MKICATFISNSSSTSFCMIGLSTDEDIYDQYYQLDYEARKNLPINIYCHDDDYYIGVDITKMQDHETLTQFKIRVGNLLEETIPNLHGCKPDFVIDSWYDG